VVRRLIRLEENACEDSGTIDIAFDVFSSLIDPIE
jgi:hypothetical protein